MVEQITAAVRHYVLTTAQLAIYDPTILRRPSQPVASFEVELVEIVDDLAYVAGPVVLIEKDVPIEQHLRLSIPLAAIDPTAEKIISPSLVRAAYIVVTNEATGACKETAAFASDDLPPTEKWGVQEN